LRHLDELRVGKGWRRALERQKIIEGHIMDSLAQRLD
jgi:hypothetical protein